MKIQLRDYLIRPGQMDDWVVGWTTGIAPLRQQEGFEISGAWVDRDHDRFVWVVGYAATDGFEAAEQRYHGRPERPTLDPNPSDFIEHTTLDMVEAMP